MNEVVLLLGSNLGDSRLCFQQACTLLENKLGAMLRKSALYQSPAWGFEHDNDFLNQVVVFRTSLLSAQILKECLQLEIVLGRDRNGQVGYAGRTIDIDLLFVNDDVVKTVDLELPHPRLHLRRFTLLPLVELMPDFIHPTLNKPIQSLLAACKDNSEVRKL